MKKIILMFAFLVPFFVTKGQNDSSKITTSGYVESYYAYSTFKDVNGLIPFQYSYNESEKFAVNTAFLKFKYNSNNVRANVGIHAGTYVNSNYSSEPGLLKNLNEANVGLKLCNNVWLDAGILNSHIGPETVVSTDNWTLTRSLSAEGYPFYETGAKVTYSKTEKFSASALVLNGWQNINDNNKNKAIGTQIVFSPKSNLSINWSTFYGEAYNVNETDSSGNKNIYASDNRFYNDLYCTFQPGKRLGLMLLFDYGVQQNIDSVANSQFFSETFMLRYKLTEKFFVCAKEDYYSNTKPVYGTALSSNIIATSLNFDYVPAKNCMLRLEGKFLNSDNNAFDNGKSNTNFVVTAALSASF